MGQWGQLRQECPRGQGWGKDAPAWGPGGSGGAQPRAEMSHRVGQEKSWAGPGWRVRVPSSLLFPFLPFLALFFYFPIKFICEREKRKKDFHNK
jgi:hypothetical protein